MTTTEIFVQQIKNSLDNLETTRSKFEENIIKSASAYHSKCLSENLPQIQRIDKRIDELQERLRKFIEDESQKG